MMEREKSMAETEVVYDSEDSSIKTNLLQQYSGRCRWLKDQRFLRELEGDSVDTETLDEELRSIQDEEPKHCRGKTLKVLESNPFQIVLCVLVLVDAGVVIAEILLDLHAIRSQLTEAESSMHLAGSYLKAFYLNDFHGNTFDDLDDILGKINHTYSNNRSVIKLKLFEHCAELVSHEYSSDTYGALNHSVLHRDIWINNSNSNNSSHNIDSYNSSENTLVKSGEDESMQSQQATNRRETRRRKRSNDSMNPVALGLASPGAREPEGRSSETNSDGGSTGRYKSYKSHKYTYAEKLLKIAHMLHYCSIAILGLFVLQVVVKMYSMGLEFFRQKMEMFDAVIICASFALDLVFLNGVGSAQGEEAAALLIVFLLWRLLRVINGLMVTAKKRQEFRIKLQKRARRKAEKRLETLEEEKRLKEEELKAIKDLCKDKGASDIEVNRCKPRKNIFHKMDTSAGLSSIAALSLGFGMSMSTSRMSPSPALTRSISPKTAPVLGKQGEIKLQNLMLRVGLVEEEEVTSSRQYLSVPKRRRRRSKSMSPKGSARSSANVSPSSSPERHLFLGNSSSNEKLKKQGSLDELITSDKNGNININQNNSYSDISDTESEAEKMVTITDEVDLHIKCSQTQVASVSDSTSTAHSLLGTNQTDKNTPVSSANSCSPQSTEVGGFKRSLTASISISDENVHRNGSCQTKRVIFASKSHPHASKSNNIQWQRSLESECDIDQTKALDSVETGRACDGQKDCLLNCRVNTELTDELNASSASLVELTFTNV